jgi:hypothetical protein
MQLLLIGPSSFIIKFILDKEPARDHPQGAHEPMIKSPFPGMDPYLEQYWGDIHSSLIVYIKDQINEQLPNGLQARVEESVMVDDDHRSRTIFPDVSVIEERDDASEGGVAVAVAQTTEVIASPLMVPLIDEQKVDRHIEIIDASRGGRVVTAIELLSPSNKREGAGRVAYLQKQKDYIQSEVNLVEIDLVRSGVFTVAVPNERVPNSCKTPYLICIRRALRRGEAELIPITLYERLPNFLIPLRATDKDIVLRLQPLVDDCYQRGRYASIDYDRHPFPPLPQPEYVWSRQLLPK